MYVSMPFWMRATSRSSSVTVATSAPVSRPSANRPSRSSFATTRRPPSLANPLPSRIGPPSLVPMPSTTSWFRLARLCAASAATCAFATPSVTNRIVPGTVSFASSDSASASAPGSSLPGTGIRPVASASR